MSYGVKTSLAYLTHMSQPGEDQVDMRGKRWLAGQVRWLVQKGDVIFPGKPTRATYDCVFTMRTSDYPSQRRRNNHRGAGSEVYREITFIMCGRDDPPTRYAQIDLG
jgi:hypothetical protein